MKRLMSGIVLCAMVAIVGVGAIAVAEDAAKSDAAVLKAKDAKNLVEIIKRLQKQGTQIHKLEINEKRDVLYRANGLLLFIYRLEAGLEFPNV